MGKTTKGTQAAASPEAVRTAQRDGTGGVPEPANAFRGKPERVPEIVFLHRRQGDSFLQSARNYYEFFGLDVQRVRSVAEIATLLASPGPVLQRIAVVSHAHPRGMILPFFTDGVRGTNKAVFREFAHSDLAGLRLISPLPPSSGNHLFNWNSIMSFLMGVLRSQSNGPDVLQPFGLDAGDSPSDPLREFFKFGFDIVYVRNPGRVRRNSASSDGINASQRNIMVNFIEEIMNQMIPEIAPGLSVTRTQLLALKTLLTSLSYADMEPNVGDFHPHLGLQDGMLNDFPTLEAAVAAVQGDFRTELNSARQRINASTLIDIRGCRAGEDEDYVEAVREFFGAGDQKPTVTAPRWFQAYPTDNRFQLPETHAHISSWIGATRWGHSSEELKTAFRNWADLIRVRPLHVDFWRSLFRGQAIRFGALTWRSEIPALFIPTPGLTELDGLALDEVIEKLKDYFDVPDADVPNASDLAGLAPVTDNLAAWSPHLLQPAEDSAPPAQRTTLFENLQQINTDLGQSLVPSASPNAPDPPTGPQLRGYQTDLASFLENTRLTTIKTFMTSAADSLEAGDGLYFYLLYAGLPVFVHGTPELSKNGLVVLRAHRSAALQSWYKCLWKDPLPDSGPHATANINAARSRQFIGLVGADRISYVSICPIPRYMHCIRKRPMPPGEDESLCQ